MPGMLSSLIWADQISVENYFKRPGKQETLALRNYQIIYAPVTNLDAAAVNNEKIRDWVASGGTLLLERENKGLLPNWIKEGGIFGKGSVVYEKF